jgi:hypothetical protein
MLLFIFCFVYKHEKQFLGLQHEKHKFYLKLLPVRLDVFGIFFFLVPASTNSSLFKTPIELSLSVLDVRLGNLPDNPAAGNVLITIRICGAFDLFIVVPELLTHSYI